ncbi:hypothetical protein A1O1_07318 [Capronia coronata CBS 617.96]|uniref:Uncharacterized protein n=1 Tax=Capronia coronata CBS 617.96 TaxID=1182541 RepID=W9YN49_9EURO|nr:uncharacterized protein A1O1_07318 [Capronia coronata CBS 617.96]EXJ83694.1 hypothetical protein A1O1_07318 [Capronia coronata CBS 617.96]
MSTMLTAPPKPARVEELSTDEDGDDKECHVFSVLEGLYPLNDSKSTPSGGKWYVRAATFTFQISCKFAIDNANVNTMLPDSKTTDPPEHTDKVEGTAVDIFARPMGDNAGKVASSLNVYITPVTPPSNLLMEVEEEGDPITTPIWQHNSAVCKNLPAALWGPCNDSLLNSAKEKTRYLMCGVSISKPDPQVSTGDKMPPFKFQLAQVEDVGTHFQFKEFDPDPESFLPLEPDDSMGGNQWDLVSKAWNHPRTGDTVADLAVQAWTDDIGLTLLGWDPKKMAVSATGDNRMTGAKPQGLLDDIGDYFLWAPMLSVPLLMKV